MVKDFESKPIKSGGKNPISTIHNIIFKAMSSQVTNNYMTVPNSSNPYITKKLNNIDEARIFKKECEDWTKLYHKTLKKLEVMIDV